MRILLASNALYFPAQGGGEKSNRLLMEALAARGHAIRVATRTETMDLASRERLEAELRARNIVSAHTAEGNLRFTLAGVDVAVLTAHSRARQFFEDQIAAFDPEIIVTSTDDPAQIFFAAALRAERARVVHLVRATIAVPFGPDASSQDDARTANLARADAIVGVSEYVANYVREWGRMPAVHVPISLMDRTEPPNLAGFGHPYVTMVNPCAVKGLPVFLAMAEARPEIAFAAVPTWGTTPGDLAALRGHANITVLPAADNIDAILELTRVLVVPSLWAEARSRLVVEAMARGIPVLASEVGGVPEAKLGVPYLLPVQPIRNYRAGFDQNMVPVAEVPPQNVAPWLAALDEALGDPEKYEQLSRQSRTAALHYIHGLTAEPFETLLLKLRNEPKRSGPAAAGLSADKRKLLALALRERAKPKAHTAGELWFPGAAGSPPGRLRLFCFPPAGAGQLFYRGWRDLLPDVSVCPVVAPGREIRSGEAALASLSEMVSAIEAAMEELPPAPCALFGHSMGGALAFELARKLRRTAKPLPLVLVVSAVSPPASRRSPLPPVVPEDGILGADIAAFRQHAYATEAPLPIPLYAFAAGSDPQIRPEAMDDWSRETSAGFERTTFPGGHMYLRDRPQEVIGALRGILARHVTV